MKRAAVVTVGSTRESLGALKLARWLRRQGYDVDERTEIRPLFDAYDLYCFSAVFSWRLPRLAEMARLARTVYGGGGRRDDMSDCQHAAFEANVNVNRLEDCGRFSADVSVRCVQCGTPFRFIGLPAGLDLNGAAVSVDGTEARLAIAPKGEVVTPLEGPGGFTVRRGSDHARLAKLEALFRACLRDSDSMTTAVMDALAAFDEEWL